MFKPPLRRMLKLSAEDLTNRAIHRRAVEVINLGMPVVSYNRIYDATVSAFGAFNKIAYVCASRPRKAGPHDSEKPLGCPNY